MSHSTTASVPGQPRYRSLDVWRGLACLMIVVLHASFYSKYAVAEAGADGTFQQTVQAWIGRLGVGVHLFFVISGYCIAATVDALRRRPHSVADYFVRRFKRIFPPYWAALALTTLLTVVVAALGEAHLLGHGGDQDTGEIPLPWTLSTWQWVGNLTLTEHWRYHLVGDGEVKLLGPSWTLCYEEQFYAVCGVLLLVWPQRFFTGVAVVSAATFLVLAVTMAGQPLPLTGFFFDGRWLLFAAGVAVYWHCNHAGDGRVLALLAAAFVGAVLLRYGYLSRYGDPERRLLAFELAVGFGFALLLIGLRRQDDALADAWVLQPLAFCGRMCYSLYLIHWPVVKLLSALLFAAGLRGFWPTLLVSVPLGTALSLLLSWLFHLAVERRFLNAPALSGDRPAAAPVPDLPPAAVQPT